MFLYIIDMMHRCSLCIGSTDFAELTFIPIHLKNFPAKPLPLLTIVERMNISSVYAFLYKVDFFIFHLFTIEKSALSGALSIHY